MWLTDPEERLPGSKCNARRRNDDDGLSIGRSWLAKQYRVLHSDSGQRCHRILRCRVTSRISAGEALAHQGLPTSWGSLNKLCCGLSQNPPAGKGIVPGGFIALGASETPPLKQEEVSIQGREQKRAIQPANGVGRGRFPQKLRTSGV
jgi:hypothetical protein